MLNSQEYDPREEMQELTEEEAIAEYHQELINLRNHNRPKIKELIDYAETNENTYLLNQLKKLRI